MTKNVLIVGSGGRNKYDYLNWLKTLGATVFLLEPENSNYTSPPSCKTYYAPFTQLDAVITKAKEIIENHSISIIDTVYELAMEQTAHLREEFGFKGLTPELVRYSRYKTSMAKFMSDNGVRTAPFIIFDENTDLKSVKKKMKECGAADWIIRPDNLTSNIGVRRIKNIDELHVILDNAKIDIKNNPYPPSICNTSNSWIANHYIRGHELEAEICVHKGDIIFLCTLLKTIIFERAWGIEENRCVTPIPWLTQEELKDFYLQIENLASAVYQKIMKPIERDTMVIYAEFRLDENNKAYVIEFTLRNGGYINPLIIETSTGTSPYYLSAAATLGINPKSENNPVRCAAGYQSVFSDREGVFEGVRGIKVLPNITIKEEMSIGDKISVPHSEILMNVVARGSCPEKVDEVLDDALSEACVLISGSSINIPQSQFRSR